MAATLFGKRLQKKLRSQRFLLYPLWFLDFVLIVVFWGVMKLLGPDRASAAGRSLFRRFAPLTAKQRHVLNNLSVAFPDLDNEALNRLARESWGNLGSILAEYPHNKRILSDPDRVTVIGTEHLQSFLESNTPMIFVTPHLGNWELSGACILRSIQPLVVVYSPLQNPLLDRVIRYFRHALGVRLISGKGGSANMLREIKSGHSLGLLPDQRAPTSTMIPFFGAPAPTTTAPARLAIASGCPVIPVRVERLRGTCFRVSFHPPIEQENTGQGKRERAIQMTQRLNQLFEGWIRERPEQWLCAKRRWPKEVYWNK